MRLYDHPLSFYAQKVKIALREKGLAFEAVLPDDFGTGRRDTPFAAANPRGEVPTLVVDGATVFESKISWNIVTALARCHAIASQPACPCLCARDRRG